MREGHLSGCVEEVMSNPDPYSDLELTERAPGAIEDLPDASSPNGFPLMRKSRRCLQQNRPLDS